MTDQTNPITMDDNNQPCTPSIPSIPSITMPFPQFELMTALLGALDAHITKQVEAKFNAMVENRRALHLMDQALETMIDDKIENAVSQAIIDHETNNVHNDSDDVERIAADTARETLKEYAETQEGWVTKDQVCDIITEQLDEEIDGIDWDEKVKDALRNLL